MIRVFVGVFIAMLIAYLLIGFGLVLQLFFGSVGLLSPYTNNILNNAMDIIFLAPFVFIIGPMSMIIAHPLYSVIWAICVISLMQIFLRYRKRKLLSRSK